MKFKLYYILLPAFFIFAGCQKDYETIEQLDEQNIQQYLTKQGLDMTYDTTGFYYQVLEDGLGDTAKYSDKVYATFTIKSLDGKYVSTDEFTNNRYSGFLGYLDREHSGLPVAFRTAVKKLHKGGSIRVIIPSRYAYGRNGSGNIPGNASLDCVLHLYDVESQDEFDEVIIQRFAAEKNLDLTRDSSGLYYKIIEQGTGTEPVTDTTQVTVQYKLRYLNGTLLQETTASKPYTSTLSSNIEGFRIGVKLLKKGGSIRLVIPSSLAYGSNTSSGIRQNAILDYDVTLTEVGSE